MYRPDLSTFSNSASPHSGDIRAVGWLDPGQYLPRGNARESFRRRLRALCDCPANVTRGFYECPFCEGEPARGNGEVHVPGTPARGYIAPSLISHYVDAHQYLPPDEFVDAVSAESLLIKPLTMNALTKAILAVANQPSPGTRDEFYREFLHGRTGVRIPAGLAPVASGEYVTGAGCGIGFPVATLTSGESAICVLADIPMLTQIERLTAFAELDAHAVLAAASANDAGVLVQCLYPQHHAWAAIPPGDAKMLLNDAAPHR